jgi:N-acetylneuraminic acid mutarotase
MGSLCKLFIALALISISVTSPGSAQPRWRYKAEMPTSRRSFAASVVNGKIYAIGGLQSTGSNQDPIRTVDRYDPSTGIWTQMADNPLPMYEHSAGVVDRKIYVMGGYPRVPTAPPSAIFQVYDPATDTWKRKADMPIPRANHCAAVVDGKIYLFGGFCFECPVPGNLLSTVSIYDPATDTWTQGADMPFPWAMPRASVVNGKIYVCTGFGGHGGGASWEQHPILAVYDPSTDTWTEGAELPFGRNDAQVAVVDARIYVMGGAIEERINGTPGRIADVIMYDPVVDAWTDAPPMSTPRRSQQACVMDNTIYSMGGVMNVPPPNGTTIISKMIEVLDLKPVVDFDGDGALDTDDLLRLIESWGLDDPRLDIGPLPWGDGIVDAEDLEVLMSRWGQDANFIAHWELDETGGDIAYDSVGQNNAIVVGDAQWQREDGHIDGALQLDGLTSYLSAPFIIDPPRQPFSAYVWIKGGQPGQTIISQEDAFGEWLSLDAAGALTCTLTFPLAPVTSSAVITDDQWHRIGLVSDGSGISLYVDDVEVARSDVSPLMPAVGNLRIGAGKNLEPGTFWFGMIDDVRIYDRVVIPQ